MGLIVITLLGHKKPDIADICSRYGLDNNLPGASRADIYNKNPTSHGRSGYYVLKTDHLFFAYCDMELDCGGNKGGWMRIADIDTSRGDNCPSGLATTLTVQEVH